MKKTPKEVSRIGWKSVAQNGQIITIVNYRNSQDVDLMFDDGTIVKHVQMHRFKNGEVRNPNFHRNKIFSTTYTANNGQHLIVVNYRTDYDLDVKFEDGTIVEHVQLSKLRNGEVRNPNFHRNKVLTTTYTANNGQHLTVIDYRTDYDLDVQFEDGTIVKHIQLSKLRNGEVCNPNCMLKRKDSINEFIILYYLKNYGFRKAYPAELKTMGFGHMELDCYNEDLHLAIEYDGFYWHKSKSAQERDIRKNTACSKNGIKLIRIRELGNILTDPINSNVVQYPLLNAHAFNKPLETLLKEVINDINAKYSTTIDSSVIDFEKDREKILAEYYQRYKKQTKCAV